MSGIFNIFKKEFKDYFLSPIAYIVITVFLIIVGWFFFSTFFLYNQAEMRTFFSLLPIIFSFVIPAITMKLFSEEKSTGSFELLYTMPVTEWEIILGKYFAALAFSIILILPTISFAIFIGNLGQLDFGPVLGGYLGAILLAAAFSSIGIFASSITKNQIIAFIIGMAFCFTLTLFDKILFFMPKALISTVEYLGSDFHFKNIAKGIIDSRDVLYFLSVAFIMLYASNLVISEKK